MMMISWCLPPRRAECLPPQRSEMRWSRMSRWCQDVCHRIYLAVYHRKMKNMMMLVMMMMMVSWIHLTRSPFYVITTCFPRGAAASRVEDLDRYGPVEDPEAPQMQHNADCTATTSYIWWSHKDWHVSHSNYSTYCITSATLQRHMVRQQSSWFRCISIHACMHRCIHAKHCVHWLCKSSFTRYGWEVMCAWTS